MKKIILTIAAVCAVTFANAQDKKEKSKGGSSDMKFGVKAGYANTNFTGDADTSAASNFYIGGLVDFSISEKFHIQPELLYSMEGADESETNLDFIRIPVMAKYYVAEGFNLQAGPEFAFVAGGGAVKDALKSLDYGLGIGAGYEMESGLMFDARYNLGLANMYDGSGFKVGTTSFNIGLGYRF
ncbi:MAG TPA: porin family protein [Flavobacterium sp.]|uniref:porin family protein n=1 Tax=Flavobacterium sp. TaxID=239 RepID=UPI002C048D94|nr:porin family protein [Flavobacterium sp.]HNP34116.1 porin family protein [Flavobacterium sp.]